jgi:hypothetical protein
VPENSPAAQWVVRAAQHGLDVSQEQITVEMKNAPDAPGHMTMVHRRRIRPPPGQGYGAHGTYAALAVPKIHVFLAREAIPYALLILPLRCHGSHYRCEENSMESGQNALFLWNAECLRHPHDFQAIQLKFM